MLHKTSILIGTFNILYDLIYKKILENNAKTSKRSHNFENNIFLIISNCWIQAVIKEVQRFRVTCLLTGQYDTEEYGTIAGVI